MKETAEKPESAQDEVARGQTAFKRLLSALHPNRDLAAEIYESLRRRHCTYFHFRGFPHREDLFDKTMEIAARRLGDVEVENIQAWLAGIAKNVGRDAVKRRHREVPLEDISGLVQPPQKDEEEAATAERALWCMNSCTGRLGAEDQKLLAGYYKKLKGEKIAYRAEMARERGISVPALRSRAFHIRKCVEMCVTKCLGFGAIGSKPRETNPNPDHL